MNDIREIVESAKAAFITQTEGVVIPTQAIEQQGLLIAFAEKMLNVGASTFMADMITELQRAEGQHGRYNSYHEAYAVILEELDEFWEIVRQKTADRDPVEARKELIQIAVTAWRTARDVLHDR